MNHDMTAHVVKLADGLKTAKKLQVQHLPSDYPKDFGFELLSDDRVEAIADQEQRWGEERLSAND